MASCFKPVSQTETIVTTNILDQIISRKKEEVANAKLRVAERELIEAIPRFRDRRPMADALAAPGIHVIAEIKRASPSKGTLRADLDADTFARAYEAGGATAISVLTDADFFQGTFDDLVKARQATTLPVLRKDFIISSYQIYETAALGADALLLIVRILSERQITDYLSLCRELKLDALVEVHSEKDIASAMKCAAKLIGINNRNLQSFETDIQTAMRLVNRLSPGQIPVALSGITCREDIENSLTAGIRNFLIGESLVRAQHPEIFLKTLLKPL
jgi:indole-3-glycerol phosphate synthase